MATTTPNYAWVVPTSSDLVKNGATAIETLGDSVDASLWNSGYGQAGKNKIINGDFAINQRGWTTSTANNSYGFDRFQQRNSGGTVTMTPQVFTAGAAPVAGYEAKNFVQLVTASQSAAGDYAILTQRMEDVRTFAGQTINISFYAKAASGAPKVGVEISQNFGSGGSPSAEVNTSVSAVTISTSFVRYNVSVTVPSISGKTVGTASSYLELNLWISAGATFATRASSIGIQNGTFQFWGVQVEYGSTATPFQTASGGSPQAELAMCQRYYVKYNSSGAKSFGYGAGTTQIILSFVTPVEMRALPTFTAGTSATTRGGDGTITPSSYNINALQANIIQIGGIVTGATANRLYVFTSTDGTELSAEL